MDYSDMRDANLGVFGAAGTYTTPAGSATSVDEAIFEENEPSPLFDNDGETLLRRARVQLSAADPAFEGGAAPVRDATWTQDSEVWTVEDVRRLPGGMFELDLVRSEVQERSREGYRLRRR